MPTTTITSKGQVTLPKEIREHLRVKSGDRVDFVVDESGRVVVQAATLDVRELRGILHRPGRRPVSLDEMEATIARHHRKRS
jgi:AbrB family looped-hinge helix DNA binding protein